MRLSAATKIRPFATMGVWNRRTLPIASEAPPPAKTTCPVSPSKPRKRLSPSAPTDHTMVFARPSVVVTIGAPAPFWVAHHAVINDGGLLLTLIATRSPAEAPGQFVPRPLNTT